MVSQWPGRANREALFYKKTFCNAGEGDFVFLYHGIHTHFIFIYTCIF